MLIGCYKIGEQSKNSRKSVKYLGLFSTATTTLNRRLSEQVQTSSDLHGLLPLCLGSLVCCNKAEIENYFLWYYFLCENNSVYQARNIQSIKAYLLSQKFFDACMHSLWMVA